jgi:colanic acid biosynthesis glycosyl transferase WcaI
MRALITTQVYPPEPHPAAVMVAELAEHLVSRGHEVTVAAGLPHHPFGRVHDGYERTTCRRESVRGVDVVRCWHFVSPSSRIAVRAAVWTSHGIAAAVGGLLAKKPDVIINYGPPLLGSILSAALATRFGSRLISVVYDLYPDIAIETGHLTNAVLIAGARQAEKLSYRVADKILVLSDGFKRTLVERGVSPEKVAVLPVWLDPNEIEPRPRDNAWRREQGIGLDKFVVLYAGTIGVVSGAAIILDVAERLKDESDVVFLFVGEGRVKDDLQRRATERGLMNMRFLPLQPRAKVAEVQATADVSLVTLAPGRGRTSVPSKVVGYMAAGRPILGCVDSDCDTAEVIDAAACGTVVPPGDVDAIVAGIREFEASPSQRQEMGRRGRSYFEHAFARDACLGQYTQLVESLAC